MVIPDGPVVDPAADDEEIGSVIMFDCVVFFIF
jgi:hypothetical protein